jgi:hypothetical protein
VSAEQPSGDGEVRGDVRRATDVGTWVHGGNAAEQQASTQETRSRVGTGRRGRGGPEERMVPPEKPTTYYDRPIVKQPVWKPEIPFYFFAGGLAGASSLLAAGATLSGRPRLARAAWRNALVAVSASPVLLIKDLGKPSRFVYMLRVFKPTSPMNVGAWLLAANGGAIALAAGLNHLDRNRRGGATELAAALLGAPLCTYTALLVSNSAIPAWSEGRRQLPFVFACGAAASAAGAAVVAAPVRESGPARRLAVLAALGEEAATMALHRRLGELKTSYEEGAAGKFGKASRVLMGAGAALIAAGGRRRPIAAAGGALLMGGALCKRWSTFKAGFNSAADPAQTVELQRRRIAERGGGAGARCGPRRAGRRRWRGRSSATASATRSPSRSRSRSASTASRWR